MKKRLRKKLYRGEYRRWVFSVRGTSSGDIVDAFLTWADGLGLMVGGRIGSERLNFVVDRCVDPRCSCGKAHPQGVVEEDRKLVADWLTANGCVVETSALWDGFNGKDPFEIS